MTKLPGSGREWKGESWIAMEVVLWSEVIDGWRNLEFADKKSRESRVHKDARHRSDAPVRICETMFSS